MVFWVSHSVNYCIKIKIIQVREKYENTSERDWGQVGENPGKVIDTEQWSHCLYVWALSIQQKCQSEISEIPRAQWNIHSGCTDCLTQATVRLPLHL